MLGDEALTPDSSRFWPRDSYAPGRSQPSFDKQFVRDYLETLDWNKTPPGPMLPLLPTPAARYSRAMARSFLMVPRGTPARPATALPRRNSPTGSSRPFTGRADFPRNRRTVTTP